MFLPVTTMLQLLQPVTTLIQLGTTMFSPSNMRNIL